MIRVSYLPEVFTRATARSWVEPWRPGSTPRSVLPDDAAPGICCWRNGARVLDENWDRQLSDHDHVVFGHRAGGPAAGFIVSAVTSDVAVALLVSAAINFVAAELLAPDPIKVDLPKPVDDAGDEESFSPTFSFRALQANPHRSGVALPIVYGSHRVAGVIINRYLNTFSSPPKQFLRTLIAVCGARVHSVAGKTAVLGSFTSSNAPKDIQLNNQPIGNFQEISGAWRTGTNLVQTVIPGYEDARASFSIARTLIQPDFGEEVSSGLAAGTYDEDSLWGDEVQVETYTAGQEADEITVTFDFPTGLFKTETGEPILAGVSLQVAYRQVDGNGAPFGDYVVPPAFEIAGKTKAAFQAARDYRIILPSSYTPPSLKSNGATKLASSGVPPANSNPAYMKTTSGALVGIPNPALNSVEFSVSAWTSVVWDPKSSPPPTGLIQPLTMAFPFDTPWRHPIFNHYDAPVGQPPRGFQFELYADPSWGTMEVEIEDGPNPGTYTTPLLGFRLISGDNSAASNGDTQVQSRALTLALMTATSASISDGPWAFVTCTYRGSTQLEPNKGEVEFTVNLQKEFAPPSIVSPRARFQTAARDVAVGSTTLNPTASSYTVRGGFDQVLFYSRAFSKVDISRLYNGGIGMTIDPDDEFDLVMGWEMDGLVGAQPDLKGNGANDLTEFGTTAQVQGAVHQPESGNALRSRVEVKCARLSVSVEDAASVASDFLSSDRVDWNSITLTLFERFRYPGIALLATEILATEQLNTSAPLITTMVEGIRCGVWDGLDAVNPTITNQFTRNPAWVIMDMALNSRYGLGDEYRIGDVVLPEFKAFADYADELVFDGAAAPTVNRVESLGVVAGYPDGQVEIKVNFAAAPPGKWPEATTGVATQGADGNEWFRLAVQATGQNFLSLTGQIQFNQWTKLTTATTTSANVATSPVTGGTSADRVTMIREPGGGQDGGVEWVQSSLNSNNNLDHVLSVYVQLESLTNTVTLGLRLDWGNGNLIVIGYSFVTNAVVVLNQTGSGPPIPGGRQLLPGGWVRLWASANKGTSSQATVRVFASGQVNDVDTMKVFLDSAQLEVGEAPTEYGAGSVSPVPNEILALDGVALEMGEFEKDPNGALPNLWILRCHQPAGSAAIPAYAAVLGQVLAERLEPRYQVDAVFDRADEMAWEAMLKIARGARAVPVRRGRRLGIFFDRPRTPVAVVTMASVVKNSFSTAYNGVRDRPNHMVAEFLDRDLNFELSQLEAQHETLNDPTEPGAYRTKRMRLEGVTRRSQVQRMLRRELNGAFLLRRTIEFTIGIDGLNLVPGDVFLFSHDVPQWGFSGRLLQNSSEDAGAAAHALYLDRSVSLVSGLSYEVAIQSAQTGAFEVVPIAAPTADVTVEVGEFVETASGLSFVPSEGDQYAFGEVGKVAKEFQVVSLRFDADELTRQVGAIEYNVDVYSDDFETLPETPISALPDPTLGQEAAGTTGETVATEGSELREGGSVQLAIDVGWRYGTDGSIGGALVELAELARDSTSPSGYRVLNDFRAVGEVGRAETTCRVLSGLRRFVRYRVRVRAISATGALQSAQGAAHADVTLVGLTMPAPALSAPTATLAGREMVVSFEKAGLGSAIEFRQGGWILGLPLGSAPASSREFETTLWAQADANASGVGTRYLAAATDGFDNVGVVRLFELSEDFPNRLASGYDSSEEDGAWSGAKVGCSVEAAPSEPRFHPVGDRGSKLAFDDPATTTATYTVSIPTRTEAQDYFVQVVLECDHVDGESWDDDRRQWNSLVDANLTWEGMPNNYREVDGADDGNVKMTIEIDQSISGTLGGDWRRYRPGQYHFKAVGVRVTFTRESGSEADFRLKRLAVRLTRLRKPRERVAHMEIFT